MAETLATTLGVIGFIAFVVYMFVGQFTMKGYFARRHGVGFDKEDRGAYRAALVGIIWPAIFFIPAFRDPRLCNHSHHVLARKQAEQEAEGVREQLDREREVGL